MDPTHADDGEDFAAGDEPLGSHADLALVADLVADLDPREVLHVLYVADLVLVEAS